MIAQDLASVSQQISCACIKHLFGVRRVDEALLEKLSMSPACFVADGSLTSKLREQRLIAKEDTAYIAGRGFGEGFEIAVSKSSYMPNAGFSKQELDPWFHWFAYLPFAGSQRTHKGYIRFDAQRYEFPGPFVKEKSDA